MQVKQFGPKALKFQALQTLAVAVQSGTVSDAIAALDSLESSGQFSGKGWKTNFAKLRTVFVSGLPEYSIFAMGGNSKLPFVAFSSLPGVTCPGAGACLDFCYSYRAWRFPASFARMAQNAYLMRHNRAAIAESFHRIYNARPEGFDFRLYVDGDFASVADVEFWMHHLTLCDKVRAYGYSKSFAVLLSYDKQWPVNYQLNISSGHNSPQSIVDKVKALPITRGDFVAVSIGRKVKSTDHGKPETNRALRESFGAKAFTCPGTCGSCTGKGHACGMPSLKGLPIIIAIH